MIFVIGSSSVSWNQNGKSLKVKSLFYVFGGIVSAVAAGALLGFLGTAIPWLIRRDTALALSAIAAVLLGHEALGAGGRLPQRDCEVPRRWMYSGALASMVRFGCSMGLGFPSRIGFWTWYVVPAAAFLSGNVLYGALVYGAYGFVRTLCGPLLMWLARSASNPLDEILPKRRNAARVVDFVVVAAVSGAVIGAYL